MTQEAQLARTCRQRSLSLTALAESLLSDIKKYEAGGRHDRASRMALQTARHLEMRLKDPKQAMFDHCTNVSVSFDVKIATPFTRRTGAMGDIRPLMLCAAADDRVDQSACTALK